MAQVHIEGQRKDKLKHINPKDITIGERFREDLGDIESLIESIKEKGIIQPITVNEAGVLLAGGRRTHAAIQMGLTSIPAIVRPSSDEIDEREIELMENVHRKDFGWAEKAKLVDRINTLKKEKDPEWSMRKTAALIDKSVGGVSNAIELANAIRVMPELGNLKTADEANKMLKKLHEQAIVQEMRKRQESGITKAEGGTGSQHDRTIAQVLRMADANYHIKDVFEGLAGLKDNGMIHIIECDPPYGIGLNEQKASKDSVDSTVHGYEEIEREKYPEFLDRITSELFRVAGKDCWLVFWYGPTWHQPVLDSLRRSGWKVDEIPAIWVKGSGQTMQPNMYYARCYEPFFLCRKGNPTMIEQGHSNVFQVNGVATAGASKKYHPTQRPVKLIEDVFNTLGAGQQIVLVPFLGSGATLRACYNLGFKGWGYDLDGKYKDQFLLAVEEDTRKLLSNPD